MKPYYENHGITLYHDRWENVSPTLENNSIDITITDPPYAKETHKGARTAKRNGVNPTENKLVDFDEVTFDQLHSYFTEISRATKRWTISFMDYHHIVKMKENPPDGMRFVRFGLWVKLGAAPQFTGDRPGMGWEGLAFLHSKDTKLSWNGGGKQGVFTYPVPRGKKRIGNHPTSKNPDMIKELLDLFANPGDTILDPFCGGCVVPWVCYLNGFSCIAVEPQEKYLENLAKMIEKHSKQGNLFD